MRNPFLPTDRTPKRALAPALVLDSFLLESAASDALVAIGAPAVPHLIQVLQERGPDYSRMVEPVTEALGKIGEDAVAAVPYIVAVLEDERVYVRATAAIALVGIGSRLDVAVPVLMQLLHTGDHTVRVRAANALSEAGPEGRAAVPVLLHILAEEGPDDEFLRHSLTSALGRFGPEAVAGVPHLATLLADPSNRVRASARVALALITRDAAVLVQLLRLNDDDVSGRVHAALVSMGASAAPAVCDGIRSVGQSISTEDDARLITAGTITLGVMARTDPATMEWSAPCLLQVARDTRNENLRTLLAGTMETFFGPPAIPYFLASLRRDLEAPPPSDPGLTITQELISATIVGSVESDAGNVRQALVELKSALDASGGELKKIIISMLATLSQLSDDVIPLLEQELSTERDPAIRLSLQQGLAFARNRGE